MIALPVLVFLARLIALAGLGGALNRVRGGLWGDWIRSNLWGGYGTTGGRLVFAVSTAVGAALIAWDWRLLALAATLFAGLLMGWFKAADLGRDGDRSRLLELALMTGRGLIMTAPSGALLFWLGYSPWFGAAGLALGLLYELGWRTPTIERSFGRGMEIAEVYNGAWIWVALSLSVPP